MKKFLSSLPFRLFVALVIGILLGQVFGIGPMKVVVSIQYILGQLITFCVPLIIIGFIAPSITRMGNNASRLLGVAVTIAYLSSICAAFMSTAAGYGLIPHLSIATDIEGLRDLPEVVFQLNIPQIMPVMSALAFFSAGGPCGGLDKEQADLRPAGGIPEHRAEDRGAGHDPGAAFLYLRHLLQPEL